jgi:hypothetical protein
MMFETQIVQELFDKEDQDLIYSSMMSKAKWNFLEDVSGSKNSLYPSHGFVHVFKHPNLGVLSEFNDAITDMFVPKLEDRLKLKIKDVHYMRAFLQIPLNENYVKQHNGIHVDLDIPHLACVYYLNDTDGDTVIYDQTYNNGVHPNTFKEHKRVTPKAGNAVIFDGSRYHCSSQPTKKLRCIINIDLII